MKGKGRNTTLIGIRLDDDVVITLQERAVNNGMRTAGEYIKSQIIKSLTNPVEKKPIPLYDTKVHKPGDTVLIRQGKKLVESIVPRVDADGNIYEG